MRRHRSVAARTVLVAAALAALGGCRKSNPSTAVTGANSGAVVPAAARAPVVALDPAQQQLAAALPAQIQRGRFPSAAATKTNARPILFLADTSSDPAVVTAALLALPDVFTHSPQYTQQRELIGPDYAEVVRRHLGSDNPAIQGAAIRASKTCILGSTPNTAVLDTLVQIASSHPSPAGRYEALNVLWNSAAIGSSPAQMAPYVQALEAPQPWLVSLALFRLTSFATRYGDRPALTTRLLALTQHADPGVRGRAAEVLGRLGAQDRALAPQVVPALVRLLDDPHAFPKSQAMNALAAVDHRPALHRIVAMLDDMTSNTYDIRGFNDLLGQSESVHHDGSAWSRVSDAGLNAIRTFSGRVGDPFRYDIRWQTVEPDLRTAATAARAWYARNQARIPQS